MCHGSNHKASELKGLIPLWLDCILSQESTQSKYEWTMGESSDSRLETHILLLNFFILSSDPLKEIWRGSFSHRLTGPSVHYLSLEENSLRLLLKFMEKASSQASHISTVIFLISEPWTLKNVYLLFPLIKTVPIALSFVRMYIIINTMHHK